MLTAYSEQPILILRGSSINLQSDEIKGIKRCRYFYMDEHGKKRSIDVVAQACDVCRMRKAKFDEGRPSCRVCRENNMAYNYQPLLQPSTC